MSGWRLGGVVFQRRLSAPRSPRVDFAGDEPTDLPVRAVGLCAARGPADRLGAFDAVESEPDTASSLLDESTEVDEGVSSDAGDGASSVTGAESSSAWPESADA